MNIFGWLVKSALLLLGLVTGGGILWGYLHGNPNSAPDTITRLYQQSQPSPPPSSNTTVEEKTAEPTAPETPNVQEESKNPPLFDAPSEPPPTPRRRDFFTPTAPNPADEYFDTPLPPASDNPEEGTIQPIDPHVPVPDVDDIPPGVIEAGEGQSDKYVDLNEVNDPKDVVWLRVALNEWLKKERRYKDRLPVDGGFQGLMDRDVELRLREFQRSNKFTYYSATFKQPVKEQLPVTGILDCRTIAAFREVLNLDRPSPKKVTDAIHREATWKSRGIERLFRDGRQKQLREIER